MRIPLVDLQAQYQTIKHEVIPALEDVLENMQLFLGPQVQAFEREFAEYCECQYGVGIATGTDALALALRACRIGPGDEFAVEVQDAALVVGQERAIEVQQTKPALADASTVKH